MFMERCDLYIGSNVSACNVGFAVEDMDYAICTLKSNKVAGSDNMSAEHLQHAIDRLPVLVTKLFNTCLVHDFVPDDFGTSLIVPVSKGDLSKLNLFEDYRPVSLINVTSKMFEVCLYNYLSHVIVTNDLQFGFTADRGCQKALMVMSTVVDYFNDKGSNVFVAGLDVSKAFDSINHYGIFIKFINANIPVYVLNTFVNWYLKLSGCVKWAGVCSQQFYMRSGVREGSVISS